MSDVTDTAGVGRRRGEGEQEDRLVDRALAEELVERAREQGVELLGENGLLRAMTKAVLERGLAEELTEHLGYEPHERAGSANARNGSTPKRLQTFLETGELDSAYAPLGLPRFRVNGFRQRGSISIAFRVIPREVPNFDELSLPPGVRRLAEEHRGLVLVTGATGSGKTTTLAAIIDHMNRSRRQHIVTIEDPIEIVHSDHGCIVNQREVGLDTASFAQALRRGLRQDPDVILIGELRDAETAETALAAAESGHLVLSTMHTVDASETIGRMVAGPTSKPTDAQLRRYRELITDADTADKTLGAMLAGEIARINEEMKRSPRIFGAAASIM